MEAEREHGLANDKSSCSARAATKRHCLGHTRSRASDSGEKASSAASRRKWGVPPMAAYSLSILSLMTSSSALGGKEYEGGEGAWKRVGDEGAGRKPS